MAKAEPRSLAEGGCIQGDRLGVQEAEGLGAQGQPLRVREQACASTATLLTTSFKKGLYCFY